jgi:hypothetical protein
MPVVRRATRRWIDVAGYFGNTEARGGYRGSGGAGLEDGGYLAGMSIVGSGVNSLRTRLNFWWRNFARRKREIDRCFKQGGQTFPALQQGIISSGEKEAPRLDRREKRIADQPAVSLLLDQLGFEAVAALVSFVQAKVSPH